MDTRALSKITHGVYLLGTKDGNRNIGCIVDAVMQISFNPSIVAISCAKSGYTQSCAMSMGKLSLSVLPKTINPALIGIFGYQSSKNIDKWEQSFLLEKDGLPFLSEGSAFFSCNILKNQEFKTHQVLFAQIVDSWQKENNTEPLTYAYYQNYLKREVIQLCQKNEIGGKQKMEQNKKTVWVCTVCGYEYDGDVPFENLPDDWVCPLCGVGKELFEQQEVK